MLDCKIKIKTPNLDENNWILQCGLRNVSLGTKSWQWRLRNTDKKTKSLLSHKSSRSDNGGPSSTHKTEEIVPTRGTTNMSGPLNKSTRPTKERMDIYKKDPGENRLEWVKEHYTSIQGPSTEILCNETHKSNRNKDRG